MGYSIFDETMVDMAWPEIEAVIRQNPVVLLPIGVIEQHGPHMGLAVDTYAVYMVAKLTRRHLKQRGLQALIAPPCYWGINGLSSSFAGSFTVRPETMKAVLLDTLQSLRNWGVNYVVALGWHGEGQHNLVILDAIKEAQAALNLKAYYIVADTQLRAFSLSGQENYVLVEKTTPPAYSSPYLDVHAGASETAVMLNYFPQHVNLEKVQTLPATQFTMEGMRAFRKGGDETRRLIPSGYIGDPAHFNVEAGKREVEEKALNYADLIEKMLKGN